MIIGKIDYINMLPFLVFLKKELRSSGSKRALEYYKGPPATINRLFQKRRVKAAMVSSIVSKNYSCTDFGIVAHKKVLSVLVCPGKEEKDKESQTSNILAKVLKLKGKVIIGDKALKENHQECIDLAKVWYERYRLPFVFARFCYQSDAKKYQKLAQKFLNKKIKIPHYILKKYAKKNGLSQKDILNYLRLIRYNIDKKGQISLKIFLKKAKEYEKSSSFS